MMEKINASIRPIDQMKKRFLWAMLATVCFSMLANGYAYFNFYPIHDAVDFTIGGPWREWQVQLGRFLIPLYYQVKSPIAMPWITGLLSMLYMGTGAFLIAELLGQDTPLGICLIGGFLSANLFTLEVNSAQQYFSDVFLFSMLFACLGVYCVWKGRGWKSLLAAVVCLFISYGVYQAFITYAACLCMLAFVRGIMLDREHAKAVVIRAALCAAAMGVAGLAYMLGGKVALRLYHTKPSDVEWSIYSVNQHQLDELWGAVKTNYKLFWRIFFVGRGYVGIPAGIATCALALLSAVLVVRKLGKRVLALLLILAVLALFPLVSRLINIFTKMNGAYRTMFAQFLIWPALTAMAFWCLPEKPRRRVAVIAATAVLSLAIILCNVRFNNGAFTIQRILNERAIYHTGRVLEDLDEFDAYNKQKKVALFGRFYLDETNEDLITRYKRVNGFGYSTGADGPYEFVHYAALLGYDLKWNPKYADIVRAKALDEVKAMPCYPEKGYIQEMGEYIVVRLGKSKKTTK